MTLAVALRLQVLRSTVRFYFVPTKGANVENVAEYNAYVLLPSSPVNDTCQVFTM